jgi:hypothetical protein
MQKLIRQIKRAHTEKVDTLYVNLKRQGCPPKRYTKLIYREKKITSQCSVNDRKYMTSQSNHVPVCEIENSHISTSVR